LKWINYKKYKKEYKNNNNKNGTYNQKLILFTFKASIKNMIN